jgi:nucleoside-diphosphate-sugar epimerase
MRIGVTGATGFLGRYIVNHLTAQGHHCVCWKRASSDIGGFDGPVEWIEGDLGDERASQALVRDCDAVIHSALDHPSGEFRGVGRDILGFVERNVVGTLKLIEAARSADVGRFIFISTCAVHVVILPDRPLDETHPLWMSNHYGAHKAAIEAFVHSYGFGMNYPICALRPTGIYGVARPAGASKWFDLVSAVARGEPVQCKRGGKEVHAGDVARAAGILLAAEGIAGQAYNCYDMYISDFDVATIAQRLSGAGGEIEGVATSPKNQIVTDKLRSLGMTFGGRDLLEQTVSELLAAVS